MYMDLQNFQDATRVAKKEAPHLLPDLANQSRAGAGANLSGEELIQNAKVAEDCRDYNKAIELYLAVTPDNIEDLDTISRVWKRAVQLSQAHVKERLQEVVRIVAKGLQDINRTLEAGEIYDNFGLFLDAAICYLQAKNYARAKQSGEQINDHEMKQRILQKIQSE